MYEFLRQAALRTQGIQRPKKTWEEVNRFLAFMVQTQGPLEDRLNAWSREVAAEFPEEEPWISAEVHYDVAGVTASFRRRVERAIDMQRGEIRGELPRHGLAPEEWSHPEFGMGWGH